MRAKQREKIQKKKNLAARGGNILLNHHLQENTDVEFFMATEFYSFYSHISTVLALVACLP